MSPRRWPLHPPPHDGEALSSWLHRLAEAYQLTPQHLMQHNLGDASFDLAAVTTARGDIEDDLDLQAPPGVLEALHERTGVPRLALARTTFAGWVPWLFDTLDPDVGPRAYTTYVQQDSVVLGPGEAVPRHLPGWRPWLGTKPMRRACPGCVQDHQDAGDPVAFALIAQIPLTTSCPLHGHQLEATFGVPGVFIAWQDPDVEATPAVPEVAAMDRLTHEGLATGVVTLPGRRVHLGVWLRLLRTLLDELNTPTSHLGQASRRRLQVIWASIGQPPRAGQSRWRAFEAQPWPLQQTTLHAAASAIAVIGTGRVEAAGTLGHVLREPTLVPAYAGDPPRRPPRPDAGPSAGSAVQPVEQFDIARAWRTAADYMEEVIALAREDPTSAQQLLTMMTAYCRDQAAYDRSRNIVIDVGVSPDVLPTYEQFRAARRAHGLTEDDR